MRSLILALALGASTVASWGQSVPTVQTTNSNGRVVNRQPKGSSAGGQFARRVVATPPVVSTTNSYSAPTFTRGYTRVNLRRPSAP